VMRVLTRLESFDDPEKANVSRSQPRFPSRAPQWIVVLDAKGWTLDDFGSPSEAEATKQAAALGDNKVDAMQSNPWAHPRRVRSTESRIHRSRHM